MKSQALWQKWAGERLAGTGHDTQSQVGKLVSLVMLCVSGLQRITNSVTSRNMLNKSMAK
jgi:hypothetical protein